MVIRLTMISGKDIFVNWSAVQDIVKTSNGSRITCCAAYLGLYGKEQPEIDVQESPEQIMAKLIRGGEKWLSCFLFTFYM